MSWKRVKIKEILKQYRVQHIVQDTIEYKQVSILNDGSVVLRGSKIGKEIGRKRQFKVDLIQYPDTLIFTRQLLLQGSVGIASMDVNDCIVTENMPMFSIQTKLIDKEFLILFLKSEVFKSRIRQIELSGSAQKSIHEKTFLDLEFSIPNLQLQKEIVVELLTLKNNGDKISSELSNQLDLVKQLRQSFLREAMQGKLVSAVTSSAVKTQETGQQLLEKIKAEKAQLIAEKKIKKEKPLTPITEDEIPFEIPDHWAWCRLGEVCNYGSSPKAEPKDINDNTWVLDLEDIEKETSVLLNRIRFKEKKSLSTKSRFKKGDVLYSKLRPYLDKVIVADEDGVCTTEILPLKLYGDLNPFFIKNTLKRSDFVTYVNSVTKGMKMPRLGTYDGQMALIPLSPLHEQEQIVAKLEELMGFCDGLEQSIKESQGYNEMLLQQVLREALQGGTN